MYMHIVIVYYTEWRVYLLPKNTSWKKQVEIDSLLLI